MSGDLRVLAELGEQLDGAARRTFAGRPARRAPRRLSWALVLVLALVLAAAAAAAVVLIASGQPLAAPHAQDLQSEGIPVPSSARLAGLDAPDPDAAAPPWDIRLSRTRAGERCSAVGQVVAGRFGIVGLDHVFRALPLGGVDACGFDTAQGPVLAGARVFAGTGPQEARTVVNGVAGSGARSVTAFGPGGERKLALGPQGSFITVYRGYVEEVRPRLVVVGADGHNHTIAFAQSSAFEVADSGGGSPWQVSGGADLEPGAQADENCAQASQELGRTNPSRFESSLTPQICGHLGRAPLFVLIRRFVPEVVEHAGFPWGNRPARTLLYGAAAPRVAALSLGGDGPARALAIDPHGGVFLAVLDGHVDPRTLTLTARLRDGRTLTYTHSTGVFGYRSNRPLAEPPVPVYRSPLPASEAFPGAPDVPLAATVRETLRARDPAGGPEWALRSWQGAPNPRANFGGTPPARFTCTQVGFVEHQHLMQPKPGSSPQPLRVGQEADGGGCNAPSELTRFPPMGETVSYVNDPFTYAPRPLRTIVSGILRPGATHPMLLGAGAPRVLALDGNRAFMAVLPGRYWDARLRITATVDGHTVTGSAVNSFPGPSAPSTPQARAPDPDGGAPWGFAAGSDGSTAYGQIVEGRLAGVEGQTGTLRNAPVGWSGGGNAPSPRKPPPVQFDTQGGAGLSAASEQAALSPPAIQRRTLPGRTLITGTADADVSSVTLVTPRDVRTLRPSGPRHVLIVVYDGVFFRGAITATVQLRDGRTVTEQVPNGPGGGEASAPPTPSLPARLRSDQITLAGMSRQVEAALHAGASERARLLRGVGLAQLQQGLRTIRSMVAVEQARIAYLRAHPNELPGE